MKPCPLLAPLLVAITAVYADPPEPKFRPVEIDTNVQIGYGVAIADVDGDKKTDILLADKKQFVWYRNPGAEKANDAKSWTKFVIAENLTAKDNVCIAAQDIDGDGKCEIAVGAEWNPADTENSGAVFYLSAPADRTQRWQAVKLHAEPTTHRMRWMQLEDGKWGLVVVPLHGRGNKNGEGAGVKVLLYHPPASLSDSNGQWRTELVDESMHMTHNFEIVRPEKGGGARVAMMLLGGREGVASLRRLSDGTWKKLPVDLTGASGPPSSGAGEVRLCAVPVGGKGMFASVEPMHGNLLVFSRADPSTTPPRMVRSLLTDKLVEGHALACGDLLGLGSDQIVVGWRGAPGKPDNTVGIALWTPLDAENGKWRESAIDPAMACEDLQLMDLNADGKLDIVASGRASKNLKIYLNERP